MKRFIFPVGTLIIVILLFMLAKATRFDIREVTVNKAPIAEGIKYLRKTIAAEQEVFHVDLIKIDPAQAEIGIAIPKVLTSKNLKGFESLSLQEYAQNGLYDVVQSGGFLSSWSPPRALGYVKVSGKEYSPIHDSWLTKGVFCTNGSKFMITKFESSATFDGWQSCLQAGPLIIDNHEIVLKYARNTWFVTDERHRQSFLCETNAGFLLMGIAENAILKSFAKTMRAPEEEGGLGCRNALLLTSKGVAGIYLNDTKVNVIGSSDVPLPNAIVVRRKRLDDED